MSIQYLLSHFKMLFPDWPINKYKQLESDTIQIWSGKWNYIFRYKTPDNWSISTSQPSNGGNKK